MLYKFSASQHEFDLFLNSEFNILLNNNVSRVKRSQWFCMAAALLTTVSTSLSCLNNPAEKNKSWTTNGSELHQQQAHGDFFNARQEPERLRGHPRVSTLTWIQTVQPTEVIEQHLQEINKCRIINMIQNQPPNEQQEDEDMMRIQQRPRLK